MSAAFKGAVARLSALGVRTVLCTGRRWRTTRPIVEQIEHAHPCVICCGGALIKEAHGHTTVYCAPLSAALARRTAQQFRAAGVVPLLLYDRPLEAREILVSEQEKQRALALPYVARNLDAVEYYEGTFPGLEEGPLEVYTVDEASRVRRAERMVREGVGGAGFVSALRHPHGSEWWALEVSARQATKWGALSWLLERWHIPPERVMAIGDDVNDVPMLEAAGLSFAMGNASPQARAAADRLTDDSDHDGVVQALRSVFPIGADA